MGVRSIRSCAALVVAGGVLAGCSATRAEPVPRLVATGGAIALVETEEGLAGVRVGTGEPLWVRSGAVAAPDGSDVFALRPSTGEDENVHEVVRVDPRTGAVSLVGTVPALADARIAAVEPGGARVAVISPEGPSTRVIDFASVTGTVRGTRTFEGTVVPEAYSSDGRLLFAARSYGDRYHVHVLDLTTGDQYPTLGPDKAQPPEDMYGSVVQAALHPDGRRLATLYRDDSTPDHTAFVHLLSLDDGLTVCIDLHAPFGTSTVGADAIEWRGTTIAVGHDQGAGSSPMLATFDAGDIGLSEPRAHYHADIRADTGAPALPAGIADVPGFRRFVALAS